MSSLVSIIAKQSQLSFNVVFFPICLEDINSTLRSKTSNIRLFLNGLGQIIEQVG